MGREILINASPFETRVAVVEGRRLAEIFIERTRDRSIAGNIYKGRVTRVLPGMQAAFVDIGLEKAAFLHGADLYMPLEDDEVADGGSPPRRGSTAVPDAAADLVSGGSEAEVRPVPIRPPIEERLKKGQEIIVQVAKPPIGSKGARVTSLLSLPGRYLVFTPSAQHVGVSRRITDEAERARLRAIVEAERPPDGGFIIRTACEGLTKREIQGDVRFLLKMWGRIQQKSEQSGAPGLLHYDMDLVLRTARDVFTADTQRLIVDNPRDYQRLQDFTDTVMPRMTPRIEVYDDPEPLFDRFGIEPQIARALDRKVWLKSGGYIVIDHTEALTVIDVNTGRYVGTTNPAETVLRTNLEAVKVVVEQLRLRNIGGLVVIDLIDMEDPVHRREVHAALQETLKQDKSRTKLLPISALGLIELTRKRARESLAHTLCKTCPTCDGRGHVKAMLTVAHEVLRRVVREASLNPDVQEITVQVHPSVASYLRESERDSVAAIAGRFNAKIVIKDAPTLPEDHYEVRGVAAAA
jgi:ribonuclease G